MRTPPLPDLPGLSFVDRRVDERERLVIEVYAHDGGWLERYVVNGEVATDEVQNEACRPHRLDGPAVITYQIPQIDQWYVDGARHRTGGPAVIRYLDGKPSQLEWWVRGAQSRLDGPAIITFTGPGGPVLWDQWWVAGSELYSDRDSVGAEAAGVLEGLPVFECEAEVAGSVFGTLLVEGISVETIVSGISAAVLTVEGMRAFADGAPVEWVRAFEGARV